MKTSLNSILEFARRNSIFLLIFSIFSFIFLQVLIRWFDLTFYFEGSFSQHQKWFPHGFIISFFCFKFLFPFIYGCWLFAIINQYSMKTYQVLLIVQSLFVSIINFDYLSIYSLVLILGTLIVYYQRSKFSKGIKTFFMCTFLYVTYMALCLYLPRVHPFAPNTMFNKFPEFTTVYLLRDENNKVIPIGKYSTINQLIEYPVLLNGRRLSNFQKGRIDAKKAMNPGSDLLKLFFSHLKHKHIPFKSISVNRHVFSIVKGQVVEKETLLLTYTLGSNENF